MYISAASLGEVAACSIRVPAEVLKQRMQVLKYRVGLIQAVKQIYSNEGSLGFYRGFQATIQREIPFACIQYPLYEFFRTLLRSEKEGRHEGMKGALCGSVAGGITGFLTTPLDVIKTRVMLSDMPGHVHSNPKDAIMSLLREGGMRRVFAGAVPRTAWIALGGGLFFGTYEGASNLLVHITRPPKV